MNRVFSTFSHACIFFPLTLSLLWSSLFFSSLLWLFPPLLFHLSILSEVWRLNFLRRVKTCKMINMTIQTPWHPHRGSHLAWFLPQGGRPVPKAERSPVKSSLEVEHFYDLSCSILAFGLPLIIICRRSLMIMIIVILLPTLYITIRIHSSSFVAILLYYISWLVLSETTTSSIK